MLNVCCWCFLYSHDCDWLSELVDDGGLEGGDFKTLSKDYVMAHLDGELL